MADLAQYVLTADVTAAWPGTWSEIIAGAVNTPVTAPAVPNTTVAAANTAGVPVLVVIAGTGVITAVTVNGTKAGGEAGSYVVPYPGTIAIAYSSGTPTWTWAAAQLPSSGAGLMTAAVSGTAPAGGQAGVIPEFTWHAGQALWLDPDGALYAALGGSSSLRAWTDGTDTVSHYGISN